MNDNGYFVQCVTTTRDVAIRMDYLAKKYGSPVDIKQLLGGRFVYEYQDKKHPKDRRQ